MTTTSTVPGSYDPNHSEHTSWIAIDPASDFSLQNLPFGIFESPGRRFRAAVAIGEYAIDLFVLCQLGYLEGCGISSPDVFQQRSLNAFISQGQPAWRAVRKRVSWLFNATSAALRDHTEHRQKVLLERRNLKMHLPVETGDYVDFYSSLEHATNVGKLFRPDNPLLPNWRHLPIGYHGRTSTLIVSGEPVRRPRGQIKPGDGGPEFAPSRRLDFELEVGFIVGRETTLGASVATADADDYIFGVVLVNDWSARDIQQWEYVPLGPFLGKSFATSVSPWVVTLNALEPFRIAGPVQDPEPLPYLRTSGFNNFDLHLEVLLQTPSGGELAPICRTNFRHMYWSMKQQLAHLTSNGTRLRIGDLCASGTVSGPEPGSYGSLLEMTKGGSEPLSLPNGVQRCFLEDGDTVVMRGHGAASDTKYKVRVGFGDLSGRIEPANSLG